MKLTSTLRLIALLAVPFIAPVSGFAQSTASAPAAATATEAATEGEVKKVDKDAGKITIKHGALKNLDMPPMTMVFRAKDPAVLNQVKVGDKITFVAEKVNGQFTASQVEVKK